MSDANKFDFDPVPLGAMPSRNFADLLPPPKPAMPVEPRPAAKPSEPAPMNEMMIDNAPPAPPALPGKMAWLPEALKALVRPTKSKGVMAAGLASLACGIGVAQYMWPTPPPKPEVKAEPAPLPTPPQPVVTVPVVTVPDVPMKIEPAEPVKIAPLEQVKLAPPTISVGTTAPEPLKLSAPSTPDIHVKPVGGTEPPAPIVPAAPAPIKPTNEAMAPPPIIIPGAAAPAPIKPTNEATAPPPIIIPGATAPAPPVIGVPDVNVKPGTVAAAPLLPDVKPVTVAPPPAIGVPDVKPITVAPPPAIGVPDVNVKPGTVAAAPLLPDAKPVTVAPPPAIGVPDVKPITVAPPEISVPDPKESPFVPSGQAKPTTVPEVVKPTVNTPLTEVKPASALAPREDYDVDIHYAASGDTWLSISKQHLGDDRYADALRAYNSGRVLAANQPVDVPPIHVLRKQYLNLIAAPKAAPQDLPRTVNGSRMYEVPNGGMSLKEIARKAFDDENYWGKVWEMNPKLRADEIVPAGTKVKLPAEAKIGE